MVKIYNWVYTIFLVGDPFLEKKKVGLKENCPKKLMLMQRKKGIKTRGNGDF